MICVGFYSTLLVIYLLSLLGAHIVLNSYIFVVWHINISGKYFAPFLYDRFRLQGRMSNIIIRTRLPCLWLSAFAWERPFGISMWLLTTICPNKFFLTGIGCYKMWQIQQYLPDLMENLFPTCLKDYCSYFNICFFDLTLHCIFCRQICKLVDLAHFFEKQLKIVWRHNVPYACCNCCLELCARYESERYSVCSVKAENLHALVGIPLQQICLRCNYCLGLLTPSEKVDLIARGRYAWLVRGYWRAICSRCSIREL